MIYLAILLTLLQAFDGWTTYKIIRRGGYEKNDLIAETIEKIGLYPTLLIFKAGAVAVQWFLAIAPTVDTLTEGIRVLAMLALFAYCGWVAVNNWKVWSGR